MPLRLYDTARQAVVAFEPAASPGGTVSIYTCGITPYDAAHLGHASTYLAYDVIRRRLHDLGYRTKLVRNVTDVDDDILRKARQLGVHYLDLAAEEMARFSTDMGALGLLPADAEPRATSAIHKILGLVEAVIKKGHAYQAGGAVYFDVASWPGFGSVSHYGPEEMLALARERGGNPDDPAKHGPLDFVLWQPSLDSEPVWSSRWGPGRPGWHIECSALVLGELGPTIDLHGGGSDLIFPHHECEAAQSEAATGQKPVRHWVHTGMACYEGAKMSKSIGNLVFVHDLVKNWEPAAVRLSLLAHRYRQDWCWDDTLVAQATERLASWRRARGGRGPGAGVAGAGLLEEVRAALDDDLDTLRALSALDAAAEGRGARAELQAAAGLLGVEL